MTSPTRQAAIPARSTNTERAGVGDSRWSHLEREADRAADLALSLPDDASAATSRMALSQPSFGHADLEPLPQTVLRTLATPGAPLESGLKSDMERRLGHDFSRVRIHTDFDAANSARELEAQAYTVGDHVVFGAGGFMPATRLGRHLIAHELAHVVQQAGWHRGSGNLGVVQRKPEGEATVVAPAQDPVAAPAKEPASAENVTEMPKLLDRFTAPAPVALAPDTPGERPNAEKIDLAGLFHDLAFGLRESRKTIESSAWDAHADLERSSKGAGKKADDHKQAADATVHSIADTRRAEIDKLVDAEEAHLAWQMNQCRQRAGDYATNAKRAQTDQFEHFRGSLAKVFNDWGRRFEKLDKDQYKRVHDTITEYKHVALTTAGNYDIQYIRSNTRQSAARAEAQREAINEVAMDFVENADKAHTDITVHLSEATSLLIRDVWKQRDEALEKYKEALPPVLKGIDDQLAAARADISMKGAQTGLKLVKIRKLLKDRVDTVEQEALKGNTRFATTVSKEIDQARTGAFRWLAHATPEAMKPIGTVTADAAELLASRKEQLDPAASRQFVGEVVQFSLDAAEDASPVFADARNRGVRDFAAVGPNAKRRFATGAASFKAQLHREGQQHEMKMTEFSRDSDQGLDASVADLDSIFQDNFERANDSLRKMLQDTLDKIYEPLEKARKDVLKAIDDSLHELSNAKWALRHEIPRAAQIAKWKYDHPRRARWVQRIDIFLGVVAAGLVLAALIFALPFILGAEAALVVTLLIVFVTSFMAGYYGAQAYDERRKAGAGRVSAFFGAVADVTGVTDAWRAISDGKMSDFERGFAVGNLLLAIYGGSKGIAGKFFKSAQVRFPKLFTNPFRAPLPGIAVEPHPLTTGAVPPELPRPGISDELKLPRETVATENLPEQAPVQEPHGTAPGMEPERPEAPQQAAKNSEPDTNAQPAEPRKTPADETPSPEDFSTPDSSQTAPAPQTDPGEPVVPAPDEPAPDSTGKDPVPPRKKRIGFELPYEEKPPTGEVEQRLHHRPKPAIPETPPPAPKGPIGFKPPEGTPPNVPTNVETPRPTGEAPPAGSGYTQMPPAREVPGSGSSAGGPTNMTGSPTTMSGETGSRSGQTPTRGAVVSNIEPEGIGAAPQPVGGRQVDIELADELAVREARAQRMAAEDALAKTQKDLAAAQEIDKELGPRPKRDYIHDEVQKQKANVAEAEKRVHEAKRTEIKAEADERIDLKRRRDLDPAAAKYDPELRQHAEEEYGRRSERVAELDEFMEANKQEIADAEAEVKRAEDAFDDAGNGEHWDPNKKERVNSRQQARDKIDQAKLELGKAQRKNVDALKAKNNQIERMQDLDRVIAPDDYPQLTADKGVYGEKQGRGYMQGDRGYKFKGSSKEPFKGPPREQGLDGVFEKDTSVPQPEPEFGTEPDPKHVVTEMKYDTSELSAGQKRTEWVDDNLEKTVGKDHANQMRKDGYDYWVVKYDPVTGKVLPPRKMWTWKPNGKIGPGGRILGDAHPYLP